MPAKLKKDYRTKNGSYSIGGTTISRRLSLESSKHGLMSPPSLASLVAKMS
jgi:hypothetical protein